MNLNLKKILIKSKKEVFSELIGNNSSKLKGEGYDFLELKEYEYGEDVKNIDWTISAKLRRPYVKVFHAQKEIDIHIVPILSGSLYFGTKKFKNELLTNICAILSFSSIKQGDNFSSYIANDEVSLLNKRSKKFFEVHSFCEKIFNYNLINRVANYTLITDYLFKTIKRKSMIFLIGDFFEIEKLDLKLLSKKHEVKVIIVRDKFEENPIPLGNVNLIDSSNSKTFQGLLDQETINSYKKELKKNDHFLYTHLQKCGVNFVKIFTDEEPISKIAGLFK